MRLSRILGLQMAAFVLAPCVSASSAGDLMKREEPIQALLDVKAGNACKIEYLKKMTFTQRPYLVLPPGSESKVPLLKASRNPDAGEKTAYLVAGDLVQLASEDPEPKSTHGFLCVYYQTPKGKSYMGWVSESALKKVPDDNEGLDLDSLLFKLPKQKWFKRLGYRQNNPGRYEADQEKVYPLVVSNAGVDAVKLKTNSAVESIVDDTDLTLKGAGTRVLRYSESFENKPALTVSAYLFNNAVYLHAKTKLPTPIIGGSTIQSDKYRSGHFACDRVLDICT